MVNIAKPGRFSIDLDMVNYSEIIKKVKIYFK